MVFNYIFNVVLFSLISILPVAALGLSPRSADGLHKAHINISYSHPQYKHTSSIIDSFRRSLDRAKVENYVRDVNIQLKLKPTIERLLIVQELGEPFLRFSRAADGTRILLGNSDKASLPESILTQLTDRNISIPWHFLIQKVHRPQVVNSPVESESSLPSSKADFFDKADGHKERVACSSWDFRPQESYIYLPRWMMESMDLRPYDTVYVTQLKLQDAIFVSISPVESSFFALSAPKAVLEEHLKQYSSLTRGTTIQITHEGITYHLRVNRIETEHCKDAECASIQDTDVSIDLVKS